MALQPISSYREPSTREPSNREPGQEATWVDAGPFRAHLTHLLAIGLTEAVVAQLTGLSLRAVRHLAHGRGGRPVRRICADTGRRLLRLTTWEARAICFRPVPVRASRHRLRLMAGAGWSTSRLADEIGLGIRDVEQIVGRGSASCPQLAAMKIAEVFARWEAARSAVPVAA